MPLYTYKCESCGSAFEVLQKSPDSKKPARKDANANNY